MSTSKNIFRLCAEIIQVFWPALKSIKKDFWHLDMNKNKLSPVVRNKNFRNQLKEVFVRYFGLELKRIYCLPMVLSKVGRNNFMISAHSLNIIFNALVQINFTLNNKRYFHHILIFQTRITIAWPRCTVRLAVWLAKINYDLSHIV
jgi:hypothetical protein